MFIAHFMGCFWIFTANISLMETVDELGNDVVEGVNWIIKGCSATGSFSDFTVDSLYITAFYFAVTSMTTVGYGDLRAYNLIERVVAIMLMMLGVIFFSIASGTFATIIT